MTRLFTVFAFILLTSFSSTKQNEIKALEEKITQLERDISNKEVNSQGQMFEEWHDYAKILEQIEKEEQDLKMLKQQLNELKQHE